MAKTETRESLARFEARSAKLRAELAAIDEHAPAHGCRRLPIRDERFALYQVSHGLDELKHLIHVEHGTEPTPSQWLVARDGAQNGQTPTFVRAVGSNAGLLAMGGESYAWHYAVEQLQFATRDDIMAALQHGVAATPDPNRRAVVLDANPVWRMPNEQILAMAKSIREEHFADSIRHVGVLRQHAVSFPPQPN